MRRVTRDEMTPAQLQQVQTLIAENLKAKAFAEDTSVGRKVRGKSPWMPSLTATLRVKDPAPVPETCECCGSSKVECVHHDEVYGREYGEWPWMLRCETCEATVGLHPFTNIPLGTLATKVMRKARIAAKEAFYAAMTAKGLTKDEGYAWLTKTLELKSAKECHIGLFGVEQCKKVVQVCNLA